MPIGHSPRQPEHLQIPTTWRGDWHLNVAIRMSLFAACRAFFGSGELPVLDDIGLR